MITRELAQHPLLWRQGKSLENSGLGVGVGRGGRAVGARLADSQAGSRRCSVPQKHASMQMSTMVWRGGVVWRPPLQCAPAALGRTLHRHQPELSVYGCYPTCSMWEGPKKEGLRLVHMPRLLVHVGMPQQGASWLSFNARAGHRAAVF